MIDNYGPVIHYNISVMLALGYPRGKCVRKRMNLNRIGHDDANLRMEVRIAEGFVVLMCRMLVQYFPMVRRERDGFIITMLLRRCYTHSDQEYGGDAT